MNDDQSRVAQSLPTADEARVDRRGAGHRSVGGRVRSHGGQRNALGLLSPDRTKTHTVWAGDALWRLADEHYGDPELWRLIAETNLLERPRELTPGQVLVIPALD